MQYELSDFKLMAEIKYNMQLLLDYSTACNLDLVSLHGTILRKILQVVLVQ
jgi:hypothetical protein